jgi:thioredoxin reductase (NADPH)
MKTPEKLDCVIIGAGPAGLTALEYLSRFHRKAVALGAEGPRARLLLIDHSYNVPGFPDGISGTDLLARLQAQAHATGGVIRNETASSIEGHDGDFRVSLNDGSILRARKLVLAMGVRDRHPDIPGVEAHIGHFIRYCPVCDGYEYSGKRLGIIGGGHSVARHALFLRTFSQHITVLLHGKSADTLGPYRKELEDKGIKIQEARVVKILERATGPSREGSSKEMPQEKMVQGHGICLDDGSDLDLEVLYSALGCDLSLEPAQNLGLDLDEDGYVLVNSQQETNVPGIYAAGDLVSQINQISVAFGQAAIAAVSIQNKLQDESPDDVFEPHN